MFDVVYAFETSGELPYYAENYWVWGLKKIILFSNQALNHVIRKEIILLENKRLAIMWKKRIGPE
jgi:hypothetical protein